MGALLESLPPCLTPSRGNLHHYCYERRRNIGNANFLLHLDNNWRLGQDQQGLPGSVCVCVSMSLCICVPDVHVPVCASWVVCMCFCVFVFLCVCVSVCLEVTTNFPLCF